MISQFGYSLTEDILIDLFLDALEYVCSVLIVNTGREIHRFWWLIEDNEIELEWWNLRWEAVPAFLFDMKSSVLMSKNVDFAYE